MLYTVFINIIMLWLYWSDPLVCLLPLDQNEFDSPDLESTQTWTELRKQTKKHTQQTLFRILFVDFYLFREVHVFCHVGVFQKKKQCLVYQSFSFFSLHLQNSLSTLRGLFPSWIFAVHWSPLERMLPVRRAGGIFSFFFLSFFLPDNLLNGTKRSHGNGSLNH